MSNVKATLVSGFEEAKKPGDFFFATPTLIQFNCPCGCERLLGIRVGPEAKPGIWRWDGNKESPTCSPSISVKGFCGWHGVLKNGVFESC